MINNIIFADDRIRTLLLLLGYGVRKRLAEVLKSIPVLLWVQRIGIAMRRI